jgi:crotonobetainyl-CoA:carnitine CoA-transferase CaiB-like acyl-CoA transferase
VFDRPEPLRGVRVVELGTLVLGPAAASFLAEMGAEVIKVELPPSGDTMRYITPGQFWKEGSLGFQPVNHNKYHVGLDVHHTSGQAVFKQLVARSDVVIENLKAGAMEAKFGLGYRQLRQVNPALVYLANTGFGQWGPFSTGRASYDALAQAASGFAAISHFPGRPPLKTNTFIGDWTGACLSATAVLIAVLHRRRTGRGQFIDYAQSEGLIRLLDWTWAFLGLTGRDREAAGNQDVAMCPAAIFLSRDGSVAVAAPLDLEFRALCGAIGRPELADDLRFHDQDARLVEENLEALHEIIGGWVLTRTSVEVLQAGQECGFSAAPVVCSRDHYQDEHLRARGAVWRFEDPVYGDAVEYGPVPKMSTSPGRLRWTARPVGFDNDHIFGTLLGLSPTYIAQLEAAGTIRTWADRPGARPPADWKGEGMLARRTRG